MEKVLNYILDWISDRIIERLEPKIEQLIDRQLAHLKEELDLTINTSLDRVFKEVKAQANPLKNLFK